MAGMSRVALAAACAMALAACGSDDAEPGAGAAPAPQATADAAPAAVPDTTFTIPLQVVAGDGGSGSVQVETEGTRTIFTVLLRAPGTGVHEGRLSEGRCDARGGAIERLEPVVTDPTGAGEAHTVVELSPGALLNGQHIVVYEGGQPQFTTMCAELPGWGADAQDRQ